MNCTCFASGRDQLVHDGDCPRRCTFWHRDYRSNAVAQCDKLVGHAGPHLPNLYRGSPSARRERGQTEFVAEPVCDIPLEAGRYSRLVDTRVRTII